jgi:hypothetical protein
MGKYIKKFENHSAYESAESGLILPNVSFCVNENEVHYKPFDPYSGHDYVEIGGIKWATMNIGANSITDTGLYFQWGDTQGYTASQVGGGEGQKYFDVSSWSDYKFTPNGIDWDAYPDYGITKYNTTDGITTLQTSDDAVVAAWGGNWRMPTTAEFQALDTATTSAWTADYEGSGVAGLILTSKADNSKKLFFPAAGHCNGGSVNDVVSGGYYWYSSLNTSKRQYAYGLYTSRRDTNWSYYYNRNYGFSVRPVIG